MGNIRFKVLSLNDMTASICLKWQFFLLKSHTCQMEETFQCRVMKITSRQFLANNRAMFFQFIPYLYFTSMKWFIFSLNCLVGPTGNYIKYQIDRTIAGPCSSHIGVKLWDHVKANFRSFHIIVCSFNYKYTSKSCKMLFSGYVGIVWWYFLTWRANWDSWSCSDSDVWKISETWS